MLLLLAILAAASQKLAVLEFRNKLPAGEQVETGYLTDEVRAAALEAAPDVEVMTRENLLVLLQSTGRDLSQCEGECEVDTGRRIGADLVVSGELIRFGTSYKLNMRMHDTHSARLLSAAVATGASIDALDRDLHAATEKLFAPLRPAPPREYTVGAPVRAPPKQVVTAVRITNETGKPLQLELRGADGVHRCDATRGCDLGAVSPGYFLMSASGAVDMTQGFKIPPGGGTINVYDRGHPLLWMGLVGIGGGGALLAGGIAAGDTAGGAIRNLGIAFGAAAIITGLILIPVDVSNLGSGASFAPSEKQKVPVEGDQ